MLLALPAAQVLALNGELCGSQNFDLPNASVVFPVDKHHHTPFTLWNNYPLQMEVPLMLMHHEWDIGQECAVDFPLFWVSFTCYVYCSVLVCIVLPDC